MNVTNSQRTDPIELAVTIYWVQQHPTANFRNFNLQQAIRQYNSTAYDISRVNEIANNLSQQGKSLSNNQLRSLIYIVTKNNVSPFAYNYGLDPTEFLEWLNRRKDYPEARPAIEEYIKTGILYFPPPNIVETGGLFPLIPRHQNRKLILIDGDNLRNHLLPFLRLADNRTKFPINFSRTKPVPVEGPIQFRNLSQRSLQNATESYIQSLGQGLPVDWWGQQFWVVPFFRRNTVRPFMTFYDYGWLTPVFSYTVSKDAADHDLTAFLYYVKLQFQEIVIVTADQFIQEVLEVIKNLPDTTNVNLDITLINPKRITSPWYPSIPRNLDLSGWVLEFMKTYHPIVSQEFQTINQKLLVVNNYEQLASGLSGNQLDILDVLIGRDLMTSSEMYSALGENLISIIEELMLNSGERVGSDEYKISDDFIDATDIQIPIDIKYLYGAYTWKVLLTYHSLLSVLHSYRSSDDPGYILFHPSSLR